MMYHNDSGRDVRQSILSSAAAGRRRTMAGLFIRSMSCSESSKSDPARRGQSASEEVIIEDQVNNAHLKKLLIRFCSNTSHPEGLYPEIIDRDVSDASQSHGVKVNDRGAQPPAKGTRVWRC